MGADTLSAIVERGLKLIVFLPVMGMIGWWLFSARLENALSFEETTVGGGLWAAGFILGAISIVGGGWGFMGVLGMAYVLLLALACWEYIAARKLDQHHLREEVERYQSAIERDPRNAAAHSFLGATYLRLSRFEEAEASLGKALELDPASKPDRRLLAQAHRRQSRLPRKWVE